MFRKLKGIRSQIIRILMGQDVNTRTEKRMLPRMSLGCRVMRKGELSFSAVKLLNISANGMAFVARDTSLQKGDRIRIVFESDSTQLVCEGEILSQQHHDYSPSTHLKYSATRFSVRFQSEMEFDFLEMLSLGFQENAGQSHMAG